MRWSEGFIAADWGTTNRRAYSIDSTGACVDEFEDDKGIMAVPKDGFQEAVGQVRNRLVDRPLLLAGMVGSNRGWIEAPYVPCPAGIDELAAALVWVEERRTAIVPGISFEEPDEADVMRGEEVQLLGAIAAGLIPSDALVCHPGTHNKWTRLEGGRIARFTTVMTGELFDLLREHSILADLLSGSADADQAFDSGVRQGLEDECLTAELFKIRARVLLGKADARDAPSYGSGLLIGADVRAGIRQGDDPDVFVMGRPELTRLYSRALQIAGRRTREIDGERAFLAGARKIVELIDERC